MRKTLFVFMSLIFLQATVFADVEKIKPISRKAIELYARLSVYALYCDSRNAKGLNTMVSKFGQQFRNDAYFNSRAGQNLFEDLRNQEAVRLGGYPDRTAICAAEEDFFYRSINAPLPFLSAARINAKGLNFSYTAAGNPKAKKLMLFLHGAPENHMAWVDYLSYFGSEDLYAVAFSMRGYYPSDIPKNIEDYTLAKMAEDTVAVAKELGFEKFILVGHDWGASTAWQTAITFPKAVEKLVIFSNLHPIHYAMAYHQVPEQKKLVDSYIPPILENKAPWTKEATLANDVEHFKKVTYTDLSSPFITSQMRASFESMWKYNNGESIEAIYNAYRALIVAKAWPLNPALKFLSTCKNPFMSSYIVKTPVLLFYGAKDPYTASESQDRFKNSGCHPNTEYVLYEDADHWLHHEKQTDAISRIHKFISDRH